MSTRFLARQRPVIVTARSIWIPGKRNSSRTHENERSREQEHKKRKRRKKEKFSPSCAFCASCVPVLSYRHDGADAARGLPRFSGRCVESWPESNEPQRRGPERLHYRSKRERRRLLRLRQRRRHGCARHQRIHAQTLRAR